MPILMFHCKLHKVFNSLNISRVNSVLVTHTIEWNNGTMFIGWNTEEKTDRCPIEGTECSRIYLGVPKRPQETSVRLAYASSEIRTGHLPNTRQNVKGSSQIDRFTQHSSQPYGQFIKPPERYFWNENLYLKIMSFNQFLNLPCRISLWY